MSRYPHTKLFSLSDPHRVVVLSGSHIQVLDAHGYILNATTNLAREDIAALIKGGPIRCSGMSRDARYLATTGDDKQLKIWDLVSFTLLSARELPKKPTSVDFSTTTDILVSDKFGDVFRYPLHADEPVTIPSDAHTCHGSLSNGELLLGHASLLTSCLLTPDERFIITADRDEHIRVSWYPQCYVVEGYCLGHKKYVSAIHIPVASPAVLISGGGDPELKIWDWITGRLQQDVTVFSAVEPFLRVMTPNGKTKSNAILVIHKIGSFFSSGETHVVFSAIGATAIFEFILTDTPNQPDIRHYNFGSPVIEFTVCDEGIIWVLLDADFPQGFDASVDRPRKLVQVVQWSVNQFVDAGDSMLLDSLNTICSLPASAEDLRALDLYSDLTSLPKAMDLDQESPALDQLQPNHELLEDELTGPGESSLTNAGLTKRALGRLKHKRALDQVQREMGDSRDTPTPYTKKIKANSDDELDSME